MTFRPFYVILIVFHLISGRMHTYHSNNNSYHDYHNKSHRLKNSYRDYEVVDGLRNEDVVVVIISTFNLENMYFRDRVIPSMRTWMRLLENVFVVGEDTSYSRLLLRHCVIKETPGFTTFDCPHEPTYILTRNCSTTYFDKTDNLNPDCTCCKMDSALQYFTSNDPQLFSHMKFLIAADDDEYIRVDQMLRWLAILDHANISHIPIIGNFAMNFNGVPGTTNCNEVVHTGFVQPAVFNRFGLETIANSVASYGLTGICRGFVTAVDVAFGVLAWQHNLRKIKIPSSQDYFANQPESLRSDSIFVHGVKNINEKDDCDGKIWSPKHKYDQQMITGCGKIDQPSPKHNRHYRVNMYDLWNYFKVNGTETPLLNISYLWNRDIFGRVTPRLYGLPGYSETEHYKRYHRSKVFVPFTRADCKIPGVSKS